MHVWPRRKKREVEAPFHSPDIDRKDSKRAKKGLTNECFLRPSYAASSVPLGELPPEAHQQDPGWYVRVGWHGLCDL